MFRDDNIQDNYHYYIANILFKRKEISKRSRSILKKILEEFPTLAEILTSSKDLGEVKSRTRKLVLDFLKQHPDAYNYFNYDEKGIDAFAKLTWQDIAAIRILDNLNHEGVEFKDPNFEGKHIINRPFELLWLAATKGTGGAEPAFFKDMLELFRQFFGTSKKRVLKKTQLQKWMGRHPSGLDDEIVEIRKKNKDRIIKILIEKMDNGDILRPKYKFSPDLSFEDKYQQILEWWETSTFHLQFAIRSPELLNKMLGRRIDSESMSVLFRAQDYGIPFFVNPYYLSLLNVDVPEKYQYTDQAIRDYIFVSKSLLDEFGNIQAWEKEDVIEPGKPNAAGWILPSKYNIHRRYPEVAILIPDTIGRACGGLCVSCQRMYDFQNGHLNFDLEDLRPQESWWDRLPVLLQYFEKDSQLRDILITGGDALMSTNKSLKRILDEVYNMVERKVNNNKLRAEGEKYAEIHRVRLGTRLPVYLPQRITDDLIIILKQFKKKAVKIGIKQFIIQTHFESAMEVTPEAAESIRKLTNAGWTVTNQMVFTAAASKVGHAAKLRKVLNEIGVLPYYTFTVKGFKENYHNFTSNSRILQEQMEEKPFGEVDVEFNKELKKIYHNPADTKERIQSINKKQDTDFLATDRNLINLPGIGKSLTFRTIGITYDGRRMLEFDYDKSRVHSPAINAIGKVIIIETKSIYNYMLQLKAMGENVNEYRNVWGYSIGETLERNPMWNYPADNIGVTKRITNLEI
jgi:lysine 2,3-aminomutase